MAKSTITVSSRSYSPGTRTVTIPNLSTDDNGIKIILTRESWPDTGSDVISGIISGSNDAGATWFELTRFSYAGGDMVNPRTHQPVLTSGPTVYWPESYDDQGVATPHRPDQVRAELTNTVTLTTAITLQGV